MMAASFTPHRTSHPGRPPVTAAAIALLATLLVPGFAVAPRVLADSALDDLAGAERGFSALSVEKGMKVAFLANLAEDGVVFRPLPVNGKKVWEARESPNVTLIWEPAYAEVSAAGDLGYTTGPWELRFPPERKQEPLHGHFNTVWRRQPDGAWRVAVDIGGSHQKPERGVGSGDFTKGPTHAAVSGEETAPDPQTLDAEYSKALRARGAAAALATHAAPDVRFNREGAFPAVGLPAARDAAAKIEGRMRLLPMGSGLSGSHDLAYTYGVAERFTTSDRAPADSSVYLNVWRRTGHDGWKLALIVLNPVTRE